MSDGWTQSAAAWIASLGEDGDWGRRHVLDLPMLERAIAGAPRNALDVGCGEGRFCRMLKSQGVSAVGVDPTAALIDAARARDPGGEYFLGRGQELGRFGDASFDLVVAYLSLIDIDAATEAIAEMTRVLAPGGYFLVANLNGFATAGEPDTWRMTAPRGERRATYDHYLDIRPQNVAWKGIKVVNWHRPLSWYFDAFLKQGLTLVEFSEPEPDGRDERSERYRRAPHFCIFRWRKPI